LVEKDDCLSQNYHKGGVKMREIIEDFIKFVDEDGEHWWIESYLENRLEDYIEKLENDSSTSTITGDKKE
jgi:hypothetical protein